MAKRNNVIQLEQHINPLPKQYRHMRYRDHNKHTWERTFSQIYADLSVIPRADDPSKTLADKARALAVKFYGLFKITNKTYITVGHTLIAQVTERKGWQNNNLLKQLANIFNIKYHRSITLDETTYRNQFIISYTESGQLILDDPLDFYILKTANTDNLTREKSQVNSWKIKSNPFPQTQSLSAVQTQDFGLIDTLRGGHKAPPSIERVEYDAPPAEESEELPEDFHNDCFRDLANAVPRNLQTTDEEEREEKEEVDPGEEFEEASYPELTEEPTAYTEAVRKEEEPKKSSYPDSKPSFPFLTTKELVGRCFHKLREQLHLKFAVHTPESANRIITHCCFEKDGHIVRVLYPPGFTFSEDERIAIRCAIHTVYGDHITITSKKMRE
jgi:hypothetical protein